MLTECEADVYAKKWTMFDFLINTGHKIILPNSKATENGVVTLRTYNVEHK